MPPELKPVLVAVVALFVGIVCYLSVLVMGWDYTAPDSPFEVDDICFVESHPGATERYVVYTPVLCSNPKKVLGARLGADMGELRFEDLDGDRIEEVIVESSSLRCRWGVAPCYDAQKVVARVCPDCSDVVKIIEKTSLDSLNTQR